MPISPTAPDALESKPHKQEICHTIDDFGGVDGRIVVL
jgi:hypothetical protein